MRKITKKDLEIIENSDEFKKFTTTHLDKNVSEFVKALEKTNNLKYFLIHKKYGRIIFYEEVKCNIKSADALSYATQSEDISILKQCLELLDKILDETLYSEDENIEIDIPEHSPPKSIELFYIEV